MTKLCLICPEVFDENQRAICRQCRNASGKKVWCCKWGRWIDGRTPDGKEPEKKIILPENLIVKAEQEKKIQGYKHRVPTRDHLLADYKTAMMRWDADGVTISQELYLIRRNICIECSGGWRCPHCSGGCSIRFKAALKSYECPIKKWQKIL